MNKTLLICLIAVAIVVAGLFGYLVYQKNKSDSSSKSVAELTDVDEVIVGSYLPVGSKIYPESDPEFTDLVFQSYMFEPLVAFDKESRIKPLLAYKWDNPDNNTWRFYLNKNAKFSDGTKVTANDVKATYDYGISKNSPVATLWPAVKEVKVVDDETVEFKTDGSDPVLLNKLAEAFFVLPKKKLEKDGNKNGIGSGPYSLSDVKEDSVVLTLRDDYWGTKPKVQKAIIKFFQKEDETADALISGQINIGQVVKKEYNEKLANAAKEGKIQVKKSLDPGVTFLGLDALRDQTPYINASANPLKNQKVKLAIEKVLNTKGYAQENDLVASSQFIPQGVFGYDPSLSPVAYNLNDAKKLMEEAGFKDGFAMTIHYPKSSESTEENALFSYIKSQLKQINITVNPENIAIENFFEKLMKKDTSVYYTGYSTDSLDASEALDTLIHTPTEDGKYGANNLGYSNPTVDKLIEEAGATMDQQSRQDKLQEAMRIVTVDDIAIIPLFQYNTSFGFSDNLYFVPRSDGALRIDEIAGKK